jgi:hypothetical protein
MSDDEDQPCIAFEGLRRIAAGPLGQIRPKVQAAMARGAAQLLVFDAETSRPVEIAPAGAPQAPPVPRSPRKPGRPRLGVVAREVTLLPRHWEWLGQQPGGASVVLRRLVDEARRARSAPDQVRAGRDALYRFMSAIGGDLPGFEDASRTLFRGDAEGFSRIIAAWPMDVCDHVRTLAARAFPAG